MDLKKCITLWLSFASLIKNLLKTTTTIQILRGEHKISIEMPLTNGKILSLQKLCEINLNYPKSNAR